MKVSNAYQYYHDEAPEVAAAFDGLIQALGASGGLDAKTMQLIYMGIKASQRDVGAVCAHVPMAKMAGASREEVKHTILLTLTVCGVSGVVTCLQAAMEAYDGVCE